MHIYIKIRHNFQLIGTETIPMLFLQVAVFYNVNADIGDPSFDVSVSIQEETIDLIETKTCTRY